MSKTKNPIKIILASSSPRRQQMLKQLGLDIDIIQPDVPEVQIPAETAHAFVQRIAADKARAAYQAVNATPLNDALIIAGDTAVVLNDTILGKPGSDQEAREMLTLLSGKQHTVMTGMCLLKACEGQVVYEDLFVVSTSVQFKQLTEKEIDNYIATGDPHDKAGAYGIQSGAAYMIREIHGSYTNVVGMPLTELVEKLEGLSIL